MYQQCWILFQIPGQPAPGWTPQESRVSTWKPVPWARPGQGPAASARQSEGRCQATVTRGRRDSDRHGTRNRRGLRHDDCLSFKSRLRRLLYLNLNTFTSRALNFI
jgi:hypothetical protein